MKRIKVTHLVILACLSTIFISLMSFSTNPFIRRGVSDSGIFVSIGKAAANGLVPYRDIFDHKGPFLWVIQSGMQFIFEGYLGVFITQTVMLFINLIIVYNIAVKYFDKCNPLFVSMLFCVILGYAYTGNSTEEYSLYLSLIGIGCALPCVIGDKACPRLIWIIEGFIFMCIFLITPVNSGTMGTLLLVLYVISIKRGSSRVKTIVINTLYAGIGCLMLVVPISVYYFLNNAFYDMIYGSFIANYYYAQMPGDAKFISPQYIFTVIIFAAWIVFYLCFSEKKRPVNLFIILSGIVNMLACFISSYSFMHYTMNLIIPVFLSIAGVMSVKREHGLGKKSVMIFWGLSLVSVSVFLFYNRPALCHIAELISFDNSNVLYMVLPVIVLLGGLAGASYLMYRDIGNKKISVPFYVCFLLLYVLFVKNGLAVKDAVFAANNEIASYGKVLEGIDLKPCTVYTYV